MKNIILTFAFAIIALGLYAQKSADRGPDFTSYSTMEQYSDFLDSMVHHWFFTKQNALNLEDALYIAPISEAEALSDSLITMRLAAMPSEFPLRYNDQVGAWVNLYIQRNRRSPYLIGLTEYYFPIFEEILDRYQLPLELKYIPIIESALNPQARSRAGAVGIWQFILSTGRMYGLEVNTYIDERKDPVKSSHAAALFMKDLYSMYGDWSLVLAAYNCGPGNVNRAIRRSGSTDFWQMYPYLPRETRGYVPAYIAAAYMMAHYEDHNIVPVKPKLSLFTDTVGVSTKMHLRQISEVLEIPYEELKTMNPQYRRDILPGDKTYYLRLPFKAIGQFIEKEEEIAAYKDSIFLGNAPIVVNPVTHRSSSSGSTYTPPSTEGKTKLSYTIKPGDTYGFIAGLYGVNVSDLRHWNRIRSNRLQIGQKIAIWLPEDKAANYAHINNMPEHQRQVLRGGGSTSSGTSSSSRFSKPTDNNYIYHQVKKGESLWTISQKYPGITDKSIQQLNGFTRRDVQTLQAGQYIKIKKK